ncbi:hypothetical protein F7P69_20765 [Cellulosimicrobium funkei]|nr:hypothetical protein [Cellulosimicrobium funkei]
MSLVLTVLLFCAVLGVPRSYFNDPSPMLGFLRIVAVPGELFAGYGAWFYLNGAIRPQHVTIDDRGVSTPAWTLAWEEIKSARVEPSDQAEVHKQQLAFYVRPGAFERVRAANRGHSGRPFGMGGLPALFPMVKTQFDTKPSAGEVFPLIEQHLEATPYEGGWRPPWPRAPQRYVRPRS